MVLVLTMSCEQLLAPIRSRKTNIWLSLQMGRGVFEIVNIGIEAGRRTLSSGAFRVSGELSKLFSRGGNTLESREVETCSDEDVYHRSEGEPLRQRKTRLVSFHVFND